MYRVIPHAQQNAFNEYLRTHKIKKVKQLWHGSRNQNWLSIMVNSLKLRPDAIITGKMFGGRDLLCPIQHEILELYILPGHKLGRRPG